MIASGSSLHCSICRELRTGEIDPAYRAHTAATQRVHRCGGGLAVIPSVSPLRLGHLLVVPDQHRCSVAQLEPTVRNHLPDLVRDLARRFGGGNQTALVFEHGLGLGHSGGCGITHAHLHVVPASPSEVRRAREEFAGAFPTESVSGLTNALQVFGSTTSYGLLGELDDLLVTTSELPSQSMRKCVAKAIQSSAWNWRELSDWTIMERTHAVLVA